MILVSGGSGTVGREVVAQLFAAGQRVRVLTRDAAKARFDGNVKVEVVIGDLGKPDTLAAAMDGVERVFALSAGPDLPAHDAALARAARAAGARQMVKLSVMGAGTASDSAIVKWHEGGERAIQESGLAWTFVRPGMFMSNAFNWAPPIKSLGKLFQPYGDGKVVPVHPRDIAAVAVMALTSPGHEGKAYPLTGPEALGMAEFAAILSEVLGKPVQYVPVSDEMAREGMLKAAVPAPLIDELLKLAARVRSGRSATVLPTVEEVLGRRPLTWLDWARENVAAFR